MLQDFTNTAPEDQIGTETLKPIARGACWTCCSINLYQVRVLYCRFCTYSSSTGSTMRTSKGFKTTSITAGCLASTNLITDDANVLLGKFGPTWLILLLPRLLSQ